MLNSLKSHFIVIFSVILFITIVYKLIEFEQSYDAEQNAEQNIDLSDNSLVFMHSVSFRKIECQN